MKSLALIIAFAAAAAADGLHGSAGRSGRRSQGVRRGGGLRRGGRQEEVEGSYAAPSEEVPVYAAEELAADASEQDAALAMLQGAIPGVPGEDYPIYSEVPETGFACDGQVDGGYYADPEAECQVFHICTADGAGGLAKYSFLCPNGTVFNQNYFICDWWFNFDCSTAEDLYSLNDEIAAEREAIAAEGAASDAVGSYEAPAPVAAPATEYYDEYVAPEEGYVADESYDYETEATEAPVDAYAVPATESLAYDDYDYATEALGVYGEDTTTLVPAIEEYLPPAEEARRGRNNVGRRGGRRGGRAGGRRGNRNQRRPSQRAGRGQFRG